LLKHNLGNVLLNDAIPRRALKTVRRVRWTKHASYMQMDEQVYNIFFEK
jgi:hypothetical protein